MADIQHLLRQKLLEHTQALVAHGGPGALTTAKRFLLHSEPAEAWLYEEFLAERDQGETWYPVAAVLAALECPDLTTLQQDWNEVLDQRGPLPLYLHPTANGHYSAMMAETVVLRHLILLTDMCTQEMLAE